MVDADLIPTSPVGHGASKDRKKNKDLEAGSPGGRFLGKELRVQKLVDVPVGVTKGAAVAVAGEIDAIQTEAVADIQQIVSNFASPLKRNKRYGESVFAQREQNLAREISQCLMTSIAIYGNSILRNLIRQGKIEGGDLTLPRPAVENVRHFLEHKEELKEAFGVDSDFYFAALMTLGQEIMPQTAQSRRRSSLMASMRGQQEASITTMVFDDENSTKELVYSINVDPACKVCLVTFRGSVTVRDWIADGNPFQSNVPDPTAQKESKKRFGSQRQKGASVVGVHQGFQNYLFAEVEGANGEKTTKYQVILGHVRTIMEEREGYRVHVTGHSLGGALATLFSFYAACEDWMPPVRCISFASPRVGNLKFRRAFRSLEEDGRIQYLRIVNHSDPIPKMPDRLVWCNAFCPDTVFRHVGVELRLFGDRCWKSKSFYAHRNKGHLSQFITDLFAATRRFVNTIIVCIIICSPAVGTAIRLHSCQVYLDRLDRESVDLSALSMGELYRRHFGEAPFTKFEKGRAPLVPCRTPKPIMAGEWQDRSSTHSFVVVGADEPSMPEV